MLEETIDDETILKYYRLGFNYELSSSLIPNLKNLTLYKAYNFGTLHALIGDDLRSVDYLSNEDILKLIKE